MTILAIAGIILFIAGLIYAVYKINEHGADKYGYSPVNLLTMALVITPYVLLIISIFVSDHRLPWTERGNFVAAIAIFALANLILVFTLVRRTSAALTMVVLPIMHVSGILLLVFYVVTSVLSGMADSDRARRY